MPWFVGWLDNWMFVSVHYHYWIILWVVTHIRGFLSCRKKSRAVCEWSQKLGQTLLSMNQNLVCSYWAVEKCTLFVSGHKIWKLSLLVVINFRGRRIYKFSCWLVSNFRVFFMSFHHRSICKLWHTLNVSWVVKKNRRLFASSCKM